MHSLLSTVNMYGDLVNDSRGQSISSTVSLSLTDHIYDKFVQVLVVEERQIITSHICFCLTPRCLDVSIRLKSDLPRFVSPKLGDSDADVTPFLPHPTLLFHHCTDLIVLFSLGTRASSMRDKRQ